MSEGKRYQLGTIGALSLSVVSSVSIVICNKALISTLGFCFGEILMGLIHQFKYARYLRYYSSRVLVSSVGKWYRVGFCLRDGRRQPCAASDLVDIVLNFIYLAE